MKTTYALTIAFSVLVSVSIAQTVDCKKASLESANEIAIGLRSSDMQRVDNAIASITNTCGISEVTLRMEILSKILQGQSTAQQIKTYYDARYYEKTLSRFNASRAIDFGYQYDRNPAWFSSVPLHHSVDSISIRIANDLLKERKLTTDEHLLCQLFSGDDTGFYEARNPFAGKDTYAGKHFKDETQQEARDRIALVLYSGTYITLGSRNIFGTNPTLGFTLASPIGLDFQMEVGVKFRLNFNDQEFEYFANDKVNDVNSKSSMSFGLIVGHKLYERRSFVIQSRLGLGIDVISTGIGGTSNTQKQNSGSTTTTSSTSNDVETLHSSLSVALMHTVSGKHYIGVEFGGHYCPYGLDTRLRTKLDTTAASAELFFRF